VVYLSPHTAGARLSILENVLHETLETGGEGHKHAKSLIKRAESAIGKRHSIIHDAWGTAPYDPRKILRRGLPFKELKPAKLVPLSELNDLVTDIRNLADDVKRMVSDSYASWPAYTWQPTPPERSPERLNRKSDTPRKGKAPKQKRLRPTSRA
jgi:hypothetical protein